MSFIVGRFAICVLLCSIAYAFVILYGARCTGMSVPTDIVIAREISLWLAAPMALIPNSLQRVLFPKGPAALIVVVPLVGTFWASVALAVVLLRRRWLRRGRNAHP